MWLMVEIWASEEGYQKKRTWDELDMDVDPYVETVVVDLVNAYDHEMAGKSPALNKRKTSLFTYSSNILRKKK